MWIYEQTTKLHMLKEIGPRSLNLLTALEALVNIVRGGHLYAHFIIHRFFTLTVNMTRVP